MLPTSPPSQAVRSRRPCIEEEGKVIRYAAAACQTDLENPVSRHEMRGNTDRMLSMIDSAVAGAAPFLPVRLVVFPEFAHAAPVFVSLAELREKLAVPIPNEHTGRLHAKAKELDIFVQSGSMLETDPKYPGVVFNTTCLIGPEGILYKYRKVNPWIPYEVHMTCCPTTRSPSSRWRILRSGNSVAPSATTGSSPRPSASWPRTARRC
jgi:predicted amidohydrolase